MSEELFNLYNQPEDHDAQSDEAKPDTAWVSPAGEPADAQDQSVDPAIKTDSGEDLSALESEKTSDSASDTADQQEAQDAQDLTPADKVFTNPYTSQNAYQPSQSYAGYGSHPSQSESGYYHQSYVGTQRAFDPQSGYRSQQSSVYQTSQSVYSGSSQSSSPSYSSYHYATQNPVQTPYTRTSPPSHSKKPERAKVGAGTVALILVVCIIVSGFAGFGGSMLYKMIQAPQNTAAGETMVIHRVEATTASADTSKLVDKGTDEIANEVADSVVEITTEVMTTSTFYGQYIATGAGSGVIISDDGYIITNNHVIDGASSVNVTLHSGESYPATVIGADDVVDIALIKIEATGLTPAVFGDSSTLEVGDKTVVIGNPLGTLGGSVSEGIVSALDRSIVIDGQTMHLMQTDAAINPGNSGGGTFNGQGELIGIVVAKSSSSSSGATIDNIGFVIPINNVLSILSDLKDYGYVRGRGDSGMTFVDLTNPMYSMYYYGNQNAGVYIYSVENGSNAASAGFQPGDRVISVNGTSVSSSSDIESIISSLSAGDSVAFELERSGRTGTLNLTLQERKPSNSSTISRGGSQNPFGSFGN